MAATAKRDIDVSRRERMSARFQLWRRRSRNDVGEFIELVSPKFVRPKHLEEAAQVLDGSMETASFLLFEAPPRHGKSELVFHHIVRLLKFKPGSRVAYVSFSADMANRKSRRIRELAAAAGIWVGEERSVGQTGVPAASVKFWETPGGGFFIAGGRGGGFVGEGFDLVVIDDPFKNRKEAESEVFRAEVFELWTGSLLQRLEPDGSVIIMHQRWHDDDLIGRLKAQREAGRGKPWVLVSLAAVANDTYDDEGRLLEGDALWPERYALADLCEICDEAGAYNWFSQYQQNPRPRGDVLFREPARYDEPHTEGAFFALACDPATTENTKNDPSGIVVGAARFVDEGTQKDPHWFMHLDILDAREVFLETPELCDELEALQKDPQWKGAPLIIEAVAGFKGVPQTLRRMAPELRISEVHPSQDKWLRAQPVAKAWNRGRVRVPRNAPWVTSYLKEMTKFTGKDKRDNRVDATAHLFDFCLKLVGGSRARARTGGRSALADSPF